MKIVYESKTGHTKEYAEMLGKELNLPIYTLKSAQKELNEKEEIIYLGWIYIERIKGLKKAKKFNLKCVCAVGDNEFNENYINALIKRSKTDIPIFYLRGGIDLDKLNVFYKLLISFLVKILKMRKSTDAQLLNRLTKSTNYVSRDNLKPVIDFIK